MSKIAFIYPGQASQYVGMGKDLYENFEIAKSLYNQANDILGFSITDVSFNGPEDALKQTKVTQPAIFVHSIIVNHLLVEKGIQPQAVGGHSLGEYSALVAAGAIDFEAALKLVQRRGELMQEAGEISPGTMAAIVGLDADAVDAVCAEALATGIVQPANYNSSQQIAISGSVAGVEKAMELASAKGAKRVIPLVVSGAFHSPLMKHAQTGLKSQLDATQVEKANIPVYTNVKALPETSPDEIKSLLFQQLTAPVRWTELIVNMISDGVTHFYEVGPGNVLTGLIKRIDRNVPCTPIGTVEQINN
ncbi:ACP S-malonyltransferase [candidate division KSB1 bacterium]|nr:ACP S-malonyltransferase [candidate division KSB1 bacterium]